MTTAPRRAVAALLLCAPLVLGAAAHADRIDDLVRREMARRKIPGASVAVLRGGKLVKIAGYGFANAETATPATPDTLYALASVSKQFTAAAVLMLVEEGKIGLDDPIRAHLDGLPEAWQPATVRHLLSHTSGIPGYTEVPGFFDEPLRRYTPTQLLALVTDKPLKFAPGARWDYSNTGYYLLGMLVEKVSGKRWDAFLTERIFQPLGMTRTRLNDLEAVLPGRASGYGSSPRGVVNVPMVHPTQPGAAGALVSTARDMARWLAAVDSGRLLPKAAWERAFTPVRLADGKTAEYGFGWQVDTVNGRRRIAHGGGIPGFSTWDMRVPSERLSLVILTNHDSANAEAIGQKIAAAAAPALTPVPPKAMADPDRALTARLQVVVANLSQGGLEAGAFTPEFAAFLTPERLAEAKAALGAQGALASFTLVSRAEKDGARELGYRAVFGTTPMRVMVRVAPDGKVAGIGFRPE